MQNNETFCKRKRKLTFRTILAVQKSYEKWEIHTLVMIGEMWLELHIFCLAHRTSSCGQNTSIKCAKMDPSQSAVQYVIYVFLCFLIVIKSRNKKASLISGVDDNLKLLYVISQITSL